MGVSNRELYAEVHQALDSSHAAKAQEGKRAERVGRVERAGGRHMRGVARKKRRGAAAPGGVSDSPQLKEVRFLCITFQYFLFHYPLIMIHLKMAAPGGVSDSPQLKGVRFDLGLGVRVRVRVEG